MIIKTVIIILVILTSLSSAAPQGPGRFAGGLWGGGGRVRSSPSRGGFSRFGGLGGGFGGSRDRINTPRRGSGNPTRFG